MTTTEGIRALLVQLVTASTSDKAAAKMGGQCDAITEGLEAYGRNKFNAGKFLAYANIYFT